MAPTLVETFPCAPATERGRGVLLGGHAGKDVVLYANGKSIVIRSLADPSNVRFYEEHQYATTVARMSPNGEWVASGDASGRVRVWGLNDNFTLKAEHQPLSGSIHDISWSDDGQRIVACGDGRGSSFAKVFLWDTGSTVGDVTGATKRVNSVDFKPCRPYRIVAGSEDFTVSFFEGPPFKFMHTPHKHANFVNCVRFSPDGTRFASVGSDGEGKIYDGKTGVPILDVPGGKIGEGGGHAGTVYACSWSPDGTKLLTAGADKTCRLWEVPVVAAEAEATTPLPKCVKLATFTFGDAAAPNPGVEHMQVGCLFVGEKMVSLSLSGDINVLNPDDPTKPKAVLVGHPKPISALTVVAPGGEGAGFDLRLGGGKHASEVCAMSAKGERALISVGMDDTYRVAPMTPGGGGAEVYEADGLKLPSQPKDVDASSDGNFVAIATHGPIVVVKGGEIVSEETSLVGREEGLCVGVRPDGGQESCASLSSMNEFVRGGEYGVYLSPTRREIAVGCKDGSVRLYSTSEDDDGRTLLTEGFELLRHRGEVTAARYSCPPPGGGAPLLATSDAKREVLVWDTATGKVVLDKMVFHNARVTCLSWSPDGIRLASGALDGGVIVWDRTKNAMLEHVRLLGAHRGGVTAMAWRDENHIVTAGFDGCVRTWNV